MISTVDGLRWSSETSCGRAKGEECGDPRRVTMVTVVGSTSELAQRERQSKRRGTPRATPQGAQHLLAAPLREVEAAKETEEGS